jgi:hypothetical protein
MRGLKGAAAGAVAVCAVAGAQAQPALAKESPAQRQLEQDRKRLYAEIDLIKTDPAKFAYEEAKEEARIGSERDKTANDRRVANGISKDGIFKEQSGAAPGVLEHLKAKEVAKLAAAAALEAQATADEARQHVASEKRAGTLPKLEAEAAALEAKIEKDEMEVAEGK